MLNISRPTNAGADLRILRGGVLDRNSSRGGGVRVQVHGNFHIRTNKQTKPRGAPPIRHCNGIPYMTLWLVHAVGYTTALQR